MRIRMSTHTCIYTRTYIFTHVLCVDILRLIVFFFETGPQSRLENHFCSVIFLPSLAK